MPRIQRKRKSLRSPGKGLVGANTTPEEVLRRMSNSPKRSIAVAGSNAITIPRRPRGRGPRIYMPTSNFAFPTPMFPFGSMMMPMSRPARLRKSVRQAKRARVGTISKVLPSVHLVSDNGDNDLEPMLELDGEVEKIDELCFFYTKYGTCLRGDACFYLHNPHCVAICDAYVKNRCYSNSCRLRHDSEKTRLPVCQYYLLGNCLDSKCPYPHVEYSSDAQICREFQHGLCFEGGCKRIHTFVCADLYESGDCLNWSRCPFQHPKNPVLLINRHSEAQLAHPRAKQIPCFYLNSKGYCSRGNSCFFSHDVQPNHILQQEVAFKKEDPAQTEVGMALPSVGAPTPLNYDSETSREGRDADVSDIDSDPQFTLKNLILPNDERFPLRTRKIRK